MSPVYVKEDCSQLASALRDCGAERLFVVCDAAVHAFLETQVLPAVDSFCGEEARVDVFEMPTSEEGKSLRTVESICSWLLECGADRRSFVLAVGGGITSDMAGFAASIYMRGIRFAYVPTTLLSMVDAAIGGKTGVNFLDYKNMLGTFCEPLFTYAATSALATLPRRELLSGASEMLKTFIIEDHDDNYAKAVDLFGRGADIQDLTSLIEAAAAVKSGIVTRDFREGGERKKLNLGHTFAHAIEHLARERHDDISHGEAVAMGMVMAARLSEKAGVAGPGLAARIEKDLRSAGLRVDCPYPVSSLAAAMGKDKKAEGAAVSFVLIRSVGDVTTMKLTPDEVAGMLA